MISKSEIKKIADLARLEIDDERVGKLKDHFSKVINHFNALNKLNTDNIKPMVTPHNLQSPLRGDRVNQELSVEEILSNAPEVKDSLFKVPPVV